MVPKLHKKGTSFKGAAVYLLHDKDRAQSAERVAWAEVRNLAIDDPKLAWRIMAATSLDQDRLKAQAGIKNTGRKSALHVLHYSLSWHAEEKDALTREEMMRAALGSIRALGADDRQALIIAHSDETHPHLHVLINRVSPENGVILSSSKEKLRLSEWAQGYEQERGKIYCEERVLNNDARTRGEFTRASKDQPRHIFEAEQVARQASNDNEKMADRVFAAQKAQDAALSQRGRDMQEKHRGLWEALTARHAARQDGIKDQAARDIGLAKAAVRQDYRPAWREALRQHEEQRAGFDVGESSLRGKAANIVEAFKWSRQVRGDDVPRSTLKTYYELLSSSGARRQALERAQAAEKRVLAQRQAHEIGQRQDAIRAQRQAALAQSRERFMAERQDVLLQVRADEAKLRAEWRTRNGQRQQAMADLQRQARAVPKVRPAFNRAAEVEPRVQDSHDGRQRQRPESPPAERATRPLPSSREAEPQPKPAEPAERLSAQEERRRQMMRDLEARRDRGRDDPDRGRDR